MCRKFFYLSLFITSYFLASGVPTLRELDLKVSIINFRNDSDESSVVLKGALYLHYYPNNFTVNPIPNPGANCTVLYVDHLFYLAHIIGIIENQVEELTCVAFCNLHPKCFSINYLPDKRICYLLSSGLTMSDVQTSNTHESVYNLKLSSRHYIFTKCFDGRFT